MDTNPYQSPATGSYGPVNGQGSSIRVEGRSLVVPTDIVLPPVCIRTNQPVSEADMVQKTLYWCSPWVALLILISGCLVILAYLLLRKRFTITYGLAPELRKKYRAWLAIKSGIAIGLLLMLIAAGNLSPEAGIVLGILFFIALVAVFVGNAPLSVTNHRRGMFWVKGCSGEFLAGIEAETGQDPFRSVETSL